MNEELCRIADDVERGVADGTIKVNTVHEPAKTKRIQWEESVQDNEGKRKKATPKAKAAFGDLNVQWGPTEEAKAEVERAARLQRVMKAREEYKALNLGVTISTVDMDEDVNQVGGALTRKQAAAASPQPSTSQEPEPTIPVSYDCPHCNKSFSYYCNLTAHIKNKHNERFCDRCSKKFDTRVALDTHRRTCRTYGLPYGNINSEFFDVEIIKQFDAAHVQFTLTPKETSDSLEIVFSEASQVMKPVFNNFLDNFKPFKMNVTLFCTMHKLREPSVIIHNSFSKPKGESTPSFQTYDDVDFILENQCDNLAAWVERFNQMASNWVLQSIDKLVYDCSEINYAKGGAGKCILPIAIEHSKAVINFELLNSEECFVYAIAMAIHHKQIESITETDRAIIKLLLNSLMSLQ